MDSDDLIFGAVYQVLLLIQGHSAAEYASCLQSADFTSYQDLVLWHVSIRVRPRFFDQVGHQTTNALIGNKHFFTK